MTATVASETRPGPARRRSPVRRAIRWVFVLVVVATVVVPLTLAGMVVVTGRHDDATPTDAVIVLGAAQFNGRPSPVLEARLGHARSLYGDRVAPRVVTVGGNQPGDITTEAQAGKDWLVQAGVPSSAITAVPTGSDTLGSLTAVAAVMARKGWTSATVVTDPAHMARSLAIARSLGIDAHGSPTTSGSGSSLTADYVARETAGLLWFWVGERRRVDQLVGT
jgi:uncharacterized SAM-binding protein YcdF (DUF218 family)